MARLLIILALLFQPVTFGLAASHAEPDCQPPVAARMTCCCGDAMPGCGCVAEPQAPTLPESAMPAAPTDAPTIHLFCFWAGDCSPVTSSRSRVACPGDALAALPDSPREARSLLCIWLT